MHKKLKKLNNIKSILKPLSPEYIGAYLDSGVQLYDLLEWILNQTGPAEITVTTFSISEEFIRKVFQFRKMGLIDKITVILDFKAIQKTENLIRFAENTFDEIYYAKTHAKILLVESSKYRVCVIGSQNATRGNREECELVTTDPVIYENLSNSIQRLKQNAVHRG